MRAVVALALAALTTAGCNKGHSLLTVTVDTDGGMLGGVDHLVVRVTDLARMRSAAPFQVPVTGGAIPPAQTLNLAFGSDVSGTVQIAVDAVAADATTLATAADMIAVAPFKSYTLHLALPTTSQPDLATPLDLAVSCATTTATNSIKFVQSQQALPTSRTEWAWDLNGDGRSDNQYGNIVGALSGQGLPMQSGVDTQISSGAEILLFDARSTDPAFKIDPCAQTQIYDGVAQTMPDYSGAGQFTIDGGLPSGLLSGTLGAGTPTAPWDMTAFVDSYFEASDPAKATTPVTMTLPLWLLSAVKVPVVALHVQYHYDGTRLVAGQINGAIRQADVQKFLIPGMAAGLNAYLMQSPCDAQCVNNQNQIKSLFDNGGAADAVHCPVDGGTATCQNPDGTCAFAGDGKISVCEVSTNAIMKNLLAPDVQLFDAMGSYAPNPQNTTKDSLSFGFGFTAVKAKF